MDNKKQIIIVGAVAVLLIGLISVIFVVSRDRPVDTTEPITGRETNKITTETNSDGNILVTNKGDGYEVTLSQGWSVPSDGTEINKISGLRVIYEPDPILLLTVTLFEATREISLEKWVNLSPLFKKNKPQRIETKEGVIYKSDGVMYDEPYLDEGGNLIDAPLENSSIVKYALKKGNRFYVVSCMALGNNATELVSECDKQIQSFTLL